MSSFEQAAVCKVEFSDQPGYTIPKFVDVAVVDGTLFIWLGLRTWAATVAWPNRSRRTVTADKILDAGIKPKEVMQ